MSVQKVILACLCGMLLWSVPMTAQKQAAPAKAPIVKQKVTKIIFANETEPAKTTQKKKRKTLPVHPTKAQVLSYRSESKQVKKKEKIAKPQFPRKNEVEEID